MLWQAASVDMFLQAQIREAERAGRAETAAGWSQDQGCSQELKRKFLGVEGKKVLLRGKAEAGGTEPQP